jgi:hypothetical protein
MKWHLKRNFSKNLLLKNAMKAVRKGCTTLEFVEEHFELLGGPSQ